MTRAVTTIGFDADDTLWHNERFYRLTEERFAALLAEHADPGDVSRRLLDDQERKLAASGLGELFDAVEIVSDKNAATYERIFARHGDGPALSLMVGNSI